MSRIKRRAVIISAVILLLILGICILQLISERSQEDDPERTMLIEDEIMDVDISQNTSGWFFGSMRSAQEPDTILERAKKFTFQESADAIPQPLNELDGRDVLRYLEREVFNEDIIQGYYRSAAPESYETEIYSYIEFNGKKYDLGRVAYGLEDDFSEWGGTSFEFTKVGIALDAAYKTIYAQFKVYGAKYDATAYYIIDDGTPKFIYEIIGVDEYYNYDDSGVYSISSTDYHVPFNEYIIYKFDLENEKILFTNLLTFFDCDGVEFDKYRRLFFTCRKRPDDEMEAGSEISERGNVYTFDNGEFVPRYTPV